MKLLLLLGMIFSMLLAAFSAGAQSLSERSKGSKFNPAIGLNALFLEDGSGSPTIQELELQFSSDVDTYFRAEATIALHQEKGEGSGHSHHFQIDPEELFVETLSIPHVTLRIGKSYTNFGKYNAVHTHALPFIDRGLLHKKMFGEEGLTEVGVGASFLLPVSWFSELSLQLINPTNESVFVMPESSKAYVVKLKNLWDLNDSTTLELGLSGLVSSYSAGEEHHEGDGHDEGGHHDDEEGEDHDEDDDEGEDHDDDDHDDDDHDENHVNTKDPMDTTMYGVDFTLKWRPTKGGRSTSFMWSTEFLRKKKDDHNDFSEGLRSFIRYQMAQRWYTQVQYEMFKPGKDLDMEESDAYSALVAFVPTEFSAIRLQLDSINKHDYTDDRLLLQLNISIGAHPAHTY